MPVKFLLGRSCFSDWIMSALLVLVGALFHRRRHLLMFLFDPNVPYTHYIWLNNQTISAFFFRSYLASEKTELSEKLWSFTASKVSPIGAFAWSCNLCTVRVLRRAIFSPRENKKPFFFWGQIPCWTESLILVLWKGSQKYLESFFLSTSNLSVSIQSIYPFKLYYFANSVPSLEFPYLSIW